MKVWKGYNGVNVIGATICIILSVSLFIFSNEKVLLGVLLRGVFSLLIIFNAIYLIFTDRPSFIIRLGQEKYRKLSGVLLLIVGLLGFVTFLMGYGINGYPRLDWSELFPEVQK